MIHILDQDKIIRDAIETVEQNGIVFLDEVDKICRASDRSYGDVSREGVRDLVLQGCQLESRTIACHLKYRR